MIAEWFAVIPILGAPLAWGSQLIGTTLDWTLSLPPETINEVRLALVGIFGMLGG